MWTNKQSQGRFSPLRIIWPINLRINIRSVGHNCSLLVVPSWRIESGGMFLFLHSTSGQLKLFVLFCYQDIPLIGAIYLLLFIDIRTVNN